MDAVDELVGQLRGRTPATRYRAAQKLGALGADAGRAVPTLLSALADRDGDVRHFAGQALRQIGEPAAKAVPGLLKELKSPMPGVRCRAAHALRQLGPLAVKAGTAFPAVSTGSWWPGVESTGLMSANLRLTSCVCR